MTVLTLEADLIGSRRDVSQLPNPDISLAVVARRRAQRHPRRAALIAPMSIFFMPIIASNARFASSPPTASASVSTRGVICQEMPHLSLHQPHWLSWPPLPTMAFQ